MDNCTENHVFITLGYFQPSILHNWIYVDHVNFEEFGLTFTDLSVDGLRTHLANHFRIDDRNKIYYYLETFTPHPKTCRRAVVQETNGFGNIDIRNYVIENEPLWDHYNRLAKTKVIAMAKAHTFSSNSPEAYERYAIEMGLPYPDIKSYNVSVGVTQYLKDLLKFHKSTAVFEESTNDNK